MRRLPVAFSRLNCIRSSSSISFGFSVISFSIAGFYRDSVFHAHEGWQPCWQVHNLHDVVWEGFLLSQMVLIPPFVQQNRTWIAPKSILFKSRTVSQKHIYIYIFMSTEKDQKDRCLDLQGDLWERHPLDPAKSHWTYLRPVLSHVPELPANQETVWIPCIKFTKI